MHVENFIILVSLTILVSYLSGLLGPALARRALTGTEAVEAEVG